MLLSTGYYKKYSIPIHFYGLNSLSIYKYNDGRIIYDVNVPPRMIKPPNGDVDENLQGSGYRM